MRVITIIIALFALTINAEARQQPTLPVTPLYSPGCNVMALTCESSYIAPKPAVSRQMRPLRVVERRIRVRTAHHRPQKAARIASAPAARPLSVEPASTLGAPSHFIPGRLICAVNVGAALAERGIKGTGSALAMSYLRWGRSAGGPVPGAVIVSPRRGGGHVAIVSRVVNGVVYAWNATGGQRGWREIPYRHHVIDYRVPG